MRPVVARRRRELLRLLLGVLPGGDAQAAAAEEVLRLLVLVGRRVAVDLGLLAGRGRRGVMSVRPHRAAKRFFCSTGAACRWRDPRFDDSVTDSQGVPRGGSRVSGCFHGEKCKEAKVFMWQLSRCFHGKVQAAGCSSPTDPPWRMPMRSVFAWRTSRRTRDTRRAAELGAPGGSSPPLATLTT